MDKYKIIFNSSRSWEEKINLCEKLALHEMNKTIYKGIKSAFKNETIWSKFYTEYKNIEGEWESHITYYYHDQSEVDLKNDWRFKEVHDRRKLANFLKLEFHENTFNLPKNHIKDYLKYLKIPYEN